MAGLPVAPPGQIGPIGPVDPGGGLVAPGPAPVAVPPIPARRVIPRWVLTAAAVGMVAALVVRVGPSQVQTALRTLHLLTRPDWTWVVAAGAACVLTHVMGAVALSGATQRHLRLGTTFQVQFASSFCNRLAPAGIGGMITNARYLQRCGLDRPAAVGAIGLNAAAGFVVHALAIAVIVPLAAPALLTRLTVPVFWLVVGAVVAGVGAVAAVSWIRSSERPLARTCSAAGRGLMDTLRCPRRAAALFGGSAGITAAYGLALTASLWAFGVRVGLVQVIMVLLVASAVSALSPTPGGVGVVEPALITGLSAVTGQVAPVVAGVLAYRLITYWLPVVPGAGLLVLLRRRNLL